MAKPTKYYSSIQEKRIADALGWEVVSGSGARDFHPGDIISDKWMGECKTHTSPCEKVKFYADVWDKICEEAASKFKYPVLFADDGTQRLENTWCIFLCDVYCPTECNLYEFPKNFRTNLFFNNKDLKSLYSNLCSWSDKLAVWKTTLSGKSIGLLPFNKFQELFEEYAE